MSATHAKSRSDTSESRDEGNTPPRQDDIYALPDGRALYVSDTVGEGVHLRIESRSGAGSRKTTKRISRAAFYRAVRGAPVVRRGARR